MEQENPYRAPASSPVIDANHYEVATSGWRLLNMWIDMAGIYGLAFLVGILIYATGQQRIVEGMNDILLGIILYLLYYTPQEALGGVTIGKLITRTRVVREDGRPITLRDALVRTLVRLVPFEAFSFLSESRPRGWHDSWSKTKVISLRQPVIPEADA